MCSSTALQRSEERIFRPGRKNPVLLRQNSPALLLLTRIRDEAHRFAIDYHRNLRGKAALHSALDQISGIGAVLRKRLLARVRQRSGHQGSSAEQLAAVKGVTRELAARIQKELQTEG